MSDLGKTVPDRGGSGPSESCGRKESREDRGATGRPESRFPEWWRDVPMPRQKTRAAGFPDAAHEFPAGGSAVIPIRGSRPRKTGDGKCRQNVGPSQRIALLGIFSPLCGRDRMPCGNAPPFPREVKKSDRKIRSLVSLGLPHSVGAASGVRTIPLPLRFLRGRCLPDPLRTPVRNWVRPSGCRVCRNPVRRGATV